MGPQQVQVGPQRLQRAPGTAALNQPESWPPRVASGLLTGPFMLARTSVVACLVLCGCEGLLSGGTTPTPQADGGSFDAGGQTDDAGVVVEPGDGGVACQVLPLMESQCGGCHGAATANGAPMTLTSLSALRAPSVFAGQTLLDRSLLRMAAEAGRMPPLPAPASSAADLQVLEQWRAEGTPDCTSGSGETHTWKTPNQIPQDLLFQCAQAEPASSPGRLRRVGKDEWSERFEVTSYGNVPPWRARAPFEHDVAHAYSTYATGETVDDATLEMFMDETMLGAAGPGAWAWVKREPGANFSCIENDAVPDDACVQHFARKLLRRGALFREPSAAELERLVTFTRTVLASGASRAAALDEVASAALLSTGALFRAELGQPGVAGRARLTDWELAQALATTLGHRLPAAPRISMRAPSGLVDYHCCSNGPRDGFAVGREGFLADIAAAADDGSISDPAVLRGFIRRHAAGELTSPDGGAVDRLDLGLEVEFQERPRHSRYWTSTRVRGFFREWLGYEAFYSTFKEQPARTSKYQPLNLVDPIYSSIIREYDGLRVENGNNTEPTMVRLLDNTIARVVVEDHDVLKTLLTTRRFYVRSRSAGSNPTPFGYDAEVAATQEGRWVEMPANERAGVLTHPAWLGAHGGNFHDDPSLVERGKWVRENLLCQHVPPLSEVQVDAMVGPSDPSLSARQRLDLATGSAECQACHRLMNPLGYPFEIYNHAGYLRQVDFGDAGVDGTAMLTDMPDPALDGPVRDAVELSEKLAASDHVKRCFVRQAFRYYMGRDETLADACTLARMETAYDQQGSFVELLESLVTSDTWLYRSTP